MKEIVIDEDFWEFIVCGPYYYDAICFTSNRTLNSRGELIMGAGIAKTFKDKIPGLPRYFGKMLKEHRDLNLMIYHNVALQIIPEFIIAFPSKENWRERSLPQLIIKSTHELKQLTNMIGWTDVLLPRPGCNLGGLNWESVKEILQDNLDNRFTVFSKE